MIDSVCQGKKKGHIVIKKEILISLSRPRDKA